MEVDETLVGGVQHGGKRGRGTAKFIVVIAVKVRQPKGFGRARMRHVPDASGASLFPFVCDVVASGTVVRTDGLVYAGRRTVRTPLLRSGVMTRVGG